ncbi:hypothetical protein [Paenibacillus guangzhouensis]|uniref:hypothetical protein n=1 Tax=Paenibacillus guangzhouensis TaxID=1473112 RepID=UPI00187B6D6F|nr:hypothetical protein [Paenibacillus guangzhouensis]
MVLIKYGDDQGLGQEVRAYERLRHFQSSNIPQVFVCEISSSGNTFLALEWIDGRHPDFTSERDIHSTYSVLGKWTAEWSDRVGGHDQLSQDTLDRFFAFNDMLVKHQELILTTIGVRLYNQLQFITANQDFILHTMKRMPNTFDPGDISLHNTIIDHHGNVIFIDFEYASVRPMIMLFEHYGEGYESIPSTPERIELAMQAFLKTWNANASQPLTWEQFQCGQVCARCCYKMGKYNYWIKRMADERHREETLEWIKQDLAPLEELVRQLEQLVVNDATS